MAILLVGAVSIAAGGILWYKEDYGATSRFFIIPVHFIPQNGYFWTWGMNGNAGSEPDAWHFHLVFAANETAIVILLWNMNESVLFSKSSARIIETFDVALPRTDKSWRWDWVVRNPNDLTLSVENFTIVHYSIKYPERHNGMTLFRAGLAATLAAFIAAMYVRRRAVQPGSQNPFRSS